MQILLRERPPDIRHPNGFASSGTGAPGGGLELRDSLRDVKTKVGDGVDCCCDTIEEWKAEEGCSVDVDAALHADAHAWECNKAAKALLDPGFNGANVAVSKELDRRDLALLVQVPDRKLASIVDEEEASEIEDDE